MKRSNEKIKQMRRVAALVLLCLLPVSVSWAAAVVKYNTLRIGQEDGLVRVMLELSGPSAMKYFSLSNPDRFVVDLRDVIRTGETPQVSFSDTPISAIRTGIRNGEDLRLVFELSAQAKGKAYLLPPADGYGHRLVIEMKETGKRSAHTVLANAVPPVFTATPAPAPVAVVQRPAPLEFKNEAPVINGRYIVIAIDAGHGGADVGAIGSRGTHEKDVVLQIARQFEERVRKEPGMVPVMIRDGDVFVSLRDRITKARSAKADMFISIHADAFVNRRASGASVYALSQRGATTEAARVLANRENSADLIGGVTLEGRDQLLASVLLDLSQNATIEASLDVAGRVLQGLKQVGKMHKHRVEQAGFVVLKSPDIPSILVETAFISNPAEEANLKSLAYQQQLADAMMNGVRSYFVSNPPDGVRIAAREHVIRRGDTLSGIATQYRVSARTLRVTNQLKDDTVRIGQVLQIPLRDS
ncbi:MAG: N-acetylmuramoyl-L-alanine amidase [Pseudomonadota bacterium]|nr:N-acetylmuramoyl-L-alanine amidase [Pseudomonadota bacterium]